MASARGASRASVSRLRLVSPSSSSIPLRLLNRGGGWELELYELTPVGRDVYRPRRFRIQGAARIRTFLVESDRRGLLELLAGRLMRRYAQRDCVFLCVNGDFWPASAVRARTRRATGPVPPRVRADGLHSVAWPKTCSGSAPKAPASSS